MNMPVKEREKLFTVITRKGFEKNSYSHDEMISNTKEPESHYPKRNFPNSFSAQSKNNMPKEAEFLIFLKIFF